MFLGRFEERNRGLEMQVNQCPPLLAEFKNLLR
jgi:hypothetical protein